jgi:hypothetical protein
VNLILAAWCSVSPEILDTIFKVTRIPSEMDSSEDFVINDTDNESESNDNGNDSSVSSDSE